jgi:hypothetical protein
MSDVHIRQLLAIVDQAYNHASWHGPNLRGSIRGVTAAQASRRPSKQRHNIWEIVVHAAYWKYVVRRRLTGQPRGSFELTGSNWFARKHGGEREWRADVALLDRTHASLREAIARLSRAKLERRSGGTTTNFALVSGIAAHDVYHAGQIQLLKKLSPGRSSARRATRRSA